MRLGDKEIEYNFEFRFYMTTKMTNPRFSPEIFSKTTIVNFAIKEEGLEDQLLALVVRKEKPELEEQKDNLVLSIAAGRKRLLELEDEILRYPRGSIHGINQCSCPKSIIRLYLLLLQIDSH